MRIVFLLLAFISASVFAQPVVINCGNSTLATTYSGSTPSLVAAFTGVTVPAQPSLMIQNPTATTICATTAVVAGVPATLTSLEHCCAPGGLCSWDFLPLPVNAVINIYLRADQASCSSGIAYADFW